MVTVTPVVVGFLIASVLVAGTLTGIAGFGFALIGTMALAMVIDPATAVVFMIIPILGVNLALVRELSYQDLRSCGQRFAPLLVSALLGTLVGMVVLEQLPVAPLRVGLGLISLAFVASVQNRVTFPGVPRFSAAWSGDTPLFMIAVGGLSGLVFGGTNVGVQLIAYLRSRDLSHGLFIGVVAMLFLGLNSLRVAAAGLLGLYPSASFALLSAAAAIPAMGGVAVGRRLRISVGERHRRLVVLGLLTFIGVRLLLAGLGIA